jgi:asparagine synthase (glutamine-hydrolysing)
MCGIVGVYHFEMECPVVTETVKAMCDRICHRGPDDEGVFVEGPVGLGMRRLSIIDLSTGHQPVYNEDRNLLIFFNGEIYNYRELRSELEGRGHHFTTRTDTETILHAYEDFGDNCPRRLNGMFAFVILDREACTLFLARDQIGIKPLYYYSTPKKFVFASEIKALLLHEGIERAVDAEALTEYMSLGYVSGDRTLFQGIRKLPAGHSMEVSGTGIRIRPYWRLPCWEADESQSLAHYAGRLRETLQAAVRRQMVSDVPLGAFLSGGMDSSSIVYLMRQVSNGPVNTYAIGFGAKHHFHNELDDARLMARSAETNHHEIVAEPNIVELLPRLVWHLDEPVADSSYIVTYLVSQLAAHSVKVILSGVGGDELFGGYRRYLGYTLNRYFLAVPRTLRNVLARILSSLPTSRDNPLSNFTRLARSFLLSLESEDGSQYRSLLQVFSRDVLSNQSLNGEVPFLSSTFATGLFAGDLGNGDLLQQMQQFDLRHSLVDDLLLLTDKMSMACSLETRVPLLDLEMIELAARIPSRYKIHGTLLRAVQKAAMKDCLPPEILQKKKRGFGCPVGAWVKQDLREYIQDCLSPSRLARHGLFETGVISRTLRDHYADRADHSDHLMALLTFEIWYDAFIQPASMQPVCLGKEA